MHPFVRDLLSALGREAHATGIRALRAGAAEVLDDIDDRLTGGLGRVRTARERLAGEPRSTEGTLRKPKRSATSRKRKSSAKEEDVQPVVIDAEVIEDE